MHACMHHACTLPAHACRLNMVAAAHSPLAMLSAQGHAAVELLLLGMLWGVVRAEGDVTLLGLLQAQWVADFLKDWAPYDWTTQLE